MITRSLKALVIVCLVTLGTETHCAFTSKDMLTIALSASLAGYIASLDADGYVKKIEEFYTLYTDPNPETPSSLPKLLDVIAELAIPTGAIIAGAGFYYLVGARKVADFEAPIAFYLGYTTTLGILIGKKLINKYG